MEENYPVLYEKSTVGRVKMTRQGMYFLLECFCRQDCGERLRLWSGDQELGLLVPQDGALRLVKRIPAKRFAEKAPQFVLKGDRPEERLVPLWADKPLMDLRLLEGARLVYRDGQPCLRPSGENRR